MNYEKLLSTFEIKKRIDYLIISCTIFFHQFFLSFLGLWSCEIDIHDIFNTVHI